MKPFLILLICLLTISCNPPKTGLIVNNEGVSFDINGLKLNNIAPFINKARLRKIGSESSDQGTTIHFQHIENQFIDLIVRRSDSDSASIYQFSAKLNGFDKWKSSDTLKLLFESADIIEAGLYSKLYKPVYAWCKPVHFNNFNQIDTVRGIQFAYWKFRDQTYASTMPLGGNGFTFSLGKESGGFGANGFTQFPVEVKGEIPILSLGFSKDIYKLISETIKQSVKAMGIPENLRVKKDKPEMFKSLGWASWNAFMQNVDEGKVLNAAKSFKEAGVPVKWFLIDDGWLDVTDNKLNSFQPNAKKFPNGFKALTSTLKNDYGIADVGVWHTLNGYWEGIRPEGEIARQFPNLISYYDCIPWLGTVEKQMQFVNPFSEDGYQFFDNWYSFLKNEGLTFVKVDNQLVVPKISKGNFPIWETGEKMLGNLHQAARKYFDGKLINCMNMVNSDFYHYSNTSVARTSEDYNPHCNLNLYDCTYMGNPAAHVLASVHNSVWLSEMVWPDYDMFQSTDPNAWLFAIAKVMSAGPVYITDEPGKHDVKLLNAITMNDGHVISADFPALPTEDCFFQLFESDKPFKVFSKSGKTGLIAAWNVSDRDFVSGTFAPVSIRDLSGESFVVFEYFSKEVTLATRKTEIPINLKRFETKLYSVYPLISNKVIIGNADKIIPEAGIENSLYSENAIQFETIDNGNFLVYCKTKPKTVTINQVQNQKFSYVNNLLSIPVETDHSNVKIDF